jgi:CBS domain-containing protein
MLCEARGSGSEDGPAALEDDMTVKSILDRKGRAVTTVERDITLVEAARLLTEKNIGAVIVAERGEKVLGILSERDIVRAVARVGADALTRSVAEFMTRDVVHCTEGNSVNEVMTVMTNRRFRHLPVDVDGKLGGIVSIGDVVRRRIEEVEREAEDIKAYIAS